MDKASWTKPLETHHRVGAGKNPHLETTCQMLQEVRESFVVATRIWGASLAGTSVDVLKHSWELVGEKLGCGPQLSKQSLRVSSVVYALAGPGHPE